MIERQHPVSGSSVFLMKRWKKHTIYTKAGSYVRTKYLKSGSYGWDGKSNTVINDKTDIAYNRTNNAWGGVYFEEPSNILDDEYQTGSVWLYDYVVVDQNFYFSHVYTSSVTNGVPSINSDYVESSSPPLWNHNEGTWINSPNSIYSNYIYKGKVNLYKTKYIYPYNPTATNIMGHDVYGYLPWYSDENEKKKLTTLRLSPDDCYFEIIKGYPRNHHSHKRQLFSLFAYNTVGVLHRHITGTLAPRPVNPTNPEGMDITRSIYFETGSYIRNRQTIKTTIGQDNLEDGTSPIQSFQVGNLKFIQTDNVINQ